MGSIVSASAFAQLLVDQQPRYSKEIIKAIRPRDSWIGHIATGKFPAHEGTSMFQDRFENVFPDVTAAWDPVPYTNCLGTPCDQTEHTITWGSTRINFALEKQSWATPLICFRQAMHVTHAIEQWNQIISDILAPATSAIMSSFIRKRAMYWADKKWVASAAMTDFNYKWVRTGTASDHETYIYTDQYPTSMLTPEMLQRRVQPLTFRGYHGKHPFSDRENLPLIELVAGMDDCWQLDKLVNVAAANSSGPTTVANYRFQQWDAASKWWRYGFSGQLGDFAIRVDPFQLRFMYVGQSGDSAYPWKFKLQVPYKNIASSGAGGAAGYKSDYDSNYDDAPYAISFIWHKQAMELQSMEDTVLNAEMPFARQNFAGKWLFVMDNLGADSAGAVVENKRRDKGQFIADFEQAMRPRYTEFCECIFHQRQCQTVYVVAAYATTHTYPTSYYNQTDLSSAPDDCVADDATQTMTPLAESTGVYIIPAGGISCDGESINNPKIRVVISTSSFTSTDPDYAASDGMQALADKLNQYAGVLGLWTRASSSTLLVSGSTCGVIHIAWNKVATA